MPHSLLKLPFLQVLGHIDFEQVNRIPNLSGGEHRVDSGQNHPGDGDDRSFLSPAFGNALIFQSIMGIVSARAISYSMGQDFCNSALG